MLYFRTLDLHAKIKRFTVQYAYFEEKKEHINHQHPYNIKFTVERSNNNARAESRDLCLTLEYI